MLGLFAVSPGILAGRVDNLGANALQSSFFVEGLSIPVSTDAAPIISFEKAGSTVQAAVAPAASQTGETQPSVSEAVPEPTVEAASDPAASSPRVESSQTSTALHVVRAGDTIDQIAVHYGVTPDFIVRANRLSIANHIEVGQRLRLVEGGTTTADARAAASSEDAFIASLVKGAQESQRVTGVPSSVTLAQAILETYWGSSYLAREANNYFGIKAYAKAGSAGVVWIDAWEVDSAGRNVVTPEPFRRYNDPGESLVDHGRFFIENSRYGYAMQATDNPREFARRINAAGYATDPAYASKLISYMDRYNLYQWDVAS